MPDVARKRWTLVLACLAQFMVILDVSVVNVALPSIRADLHFSAVDLQWVVNAYTLTFAGFLMLGGRAADLLGHRRMFVVGLLAFAGASLAGGLSQTQGMLIVARGVQGIGGAIVAPVTLSIITTTFTEGAERNRALSLWGAMGAAGGAAGVLVGGILTDLLGWQWILFINVPIGVLAAVAAQRVIVDRHEVAPPGQRHYDAAGAITVTAGLMIVTWAIVRTDVNGWGSAATLGTMAAGLLVLALFVAIEGRWSKRPLIPLGVFANRSVSMANVTVFFLGCAVFAMWYFVSLYLQEVKGYSPIEAGLAFLPMTAALGATSTRAGKLALRFGPQRVLSVGMALIGVGMLLFARVQVDGSYAEFVVLPGLVTAVGIGLAFVTVTIAATAGVEPGEAGLASGLVNTSRQFGGSLGLAILATIAHARSAHVAHGAQIGNSALTAGFRVAFIVGAGFAFAGAVSSGLGLARVRARRPPAPAAADARP